MNAIEALGIPVTDQQPDCVTCGLSIVTRFGGEAWIQCASCEADGDLRDRAGDSQRTPAGASQPSPEEAS